MFDATDIRIDCKILKRLLLYLKLLFHSFHLSVLEKELEEAKDIFGDSDEGARGIKSFN